MSFLKLTTWNVNGIRARESQLLEWLSTQQPDILCLQEIKASPKDVPLSLVEHPDYWGFWHGHKGYSGVALLVRKERFSRAPEFFHPAFDHENRIVAARLGELLVCSVYVPNGGKDFEAKIKFLNEMISFVEEAEQSHQWLALCGDLNVARELRDVHPKLQKADQIGQTPQERALFDRLLSKGLVDLSRQFEPNNESLFTWWAPWRNQRERNIGWRLDYLLCSRVVAEKAQSCVATREFGTSDHGPVLASFDLPEVRIAAAG